MGRAESSTRTKTDLMENTIDTSHEVDVKRGVQKELSNMADEFDRRADSKEKMYVDLEMPQSSEREGWELRDVARQLRKRVEILGMGLQKPSNGR